MCFDVQSSLLAWSLALSIAFYLFFRNRGYDRWNAAFILTFTLIQLIEAGLWSSLDDPRLNALLTEIVMLALLMQPVVQSFMSNLYEPNIASKILLGLSLAAFVWGLWKVYTYKKGFHTDVGPNGHLVWNLPFGAIIGAIYMAGLFVPLFFMKDYKWVPLLGVGAITLLYSLKVGSKTEEWSSLWCITAVSYAIVALY